MVKKYSSTPSDGDPPSHSPEDDERGKGNGSGKGKGKEKEREEGKEGEEREEGKEKEKEEGKEKGEGKEEGKEEDIGIVASTKPIELETVDESNTFLDQQETMLKSLTEEERWVIRGRSFKLSSNIH